MKKFNYVIVVVMITSFLLSACAPSDWARNDMPLAGLTHAVTYTLTGPANSEKEENIARLRGVNDYSPILMEETVFGRMSGTKTQDVTITLPDGRPVRALGMIKPKRFAGLTNYATLEPAGFWIQDVFGNTYCGLKVRLDFNRNFLQYADPNKRDYQSIWYYDVPCEAPTDGQPAKLLIDQATPRALVLNEVMQIRVTGGSVFYNWGHSTTIHNGPWTQIPLRWWEHWDIEGIGDEKAALELMHGMVIDLESSPQPWMEFNPNGDYRDSWLSYSAGDADKYATFDRIFLNRQTEYVVFQRPDREIAWDYVRIVPTYNEEWNDVHDHLWSIKKWSGNYQEFDFYEEVKVNGQTEKVLKDDPTVSQQIKEIERVGWINAPNATLDQIKWIAPDGTILYVMTVRAHIGARDTLVIFGDAIPDLGLRNSVSIDDKMPMPPPKLGDNGKPDPEFRQWDANDWTDWLKESSFWNFMKDNPNAVSADLLVQYRFQDDTKWSQIYCTDSNGGRYVCGMEPAEWNLSASYYMEGDPEKPWYILQTLGEVGMRTLGLSYASSLYEGTGMEFALDQRLFYDKFYQGFTQEDVWTFDARAMQLPSTLDKSWSFLYSFIED